MIVGRAHTGLTDVTEAEMTSLTPEGFTLAVKIPDAVRSMTVAFSRPIDGLYDLQPQSLAIVASARASLGITELTSAELEAASIASLETYITSVVRSRTSPSTSSRSRSAAATSATSRRSARTHSCTSSLRRLAATNSPSTPTSVGSSTN